MKDTSIKDLREKLKSEMAAEELALKSEIKAVASKFESRTGLTVIVSIGISDRSDKSSGVTLL